MVIWYLLAFIILANRTDGRTQHQHSNILCPRKCICYNDKEQGFAVTVDCSTKKLTGVPFGIPPNTENLILKDNQIQSIDNSSFSSLYSLKRLDISENALLNIDKGTFQNLGHLLILNMSWNHMELSNFTVDQSLFLPLKLLEVLDICGNNDVTDVTIDYPDSALSHLTSLKVLYMDGLPHKELGPGFQNLRKLEVFNISGISGFCNICVISDYTFMNLQHSPIAQLNVANCSITGIASLSLIYFPRIQTLDISRNVNLGAKPMFAAARGLRNSSIHTIYAVEITHLSQTWEYITKSDLCPLQKMGLKEIYMDYNYMLSIEPAVIECVPDSLEILSATYTFVYAHLMLTVCCKNLRVINISHEYVRPPNEIQSHQVEYVEYVRPPNEIQSYQVEYVEEPSTWYPNNSSANGLILFIPPRLAVVDIHDAATFSTFSFPSVEIAKNDLQFIDASGLHITSWRGPVKGLTNLTFLDLSNNSCTYVRPGFFISFTSLKFLNLQNNILGPVIGKDVDGDMLHVMSRLERFDLSNNDVNTIPPRFFQGVSALETLILSHNALNVSLFNLAYVMRLKVLDLSYNNLPYLSKIVTDNLDIINKHGNLSLDLSGNIFQCSCGTINFIQWINITKVSFKRFENYSCRFENGTETSFQSLKLILTALDRECYTFTILIIVLSIVHLIFISIPVLYLLYKKRYWYFIYWFYNWVRRTQLDIETRLQPHENFAHDVFISYDEENGQFVKYKLMPYLTEKKLNVHIHDLEFIPGETIYACIFRAIRNSRLTLVVLSNAYVNNDECVSELHMARQESIHNRVDILVVLIIEELFDTPQEVKKLLAHVSNIVVNDDWALEHCLASITNLLPDTIHDD